MNAREVRALRHTLGWTQHDLAAHLGVSQPLVSSWESGKRQPDGPALQGLARLATTVPTESPVPPERMAMLGAVLKLLDEGADGLSVDRVADRLGVPADAVASHFPAEGSFTDGMLQAYRERMGAQIDELERLHRRRGADHARLRAYLDQADFPAGSPLTAAEHRAAMLAFLAGERRTFERMAKWYEDQMNRALTDLPEGSKRDEVQLVLLAVDALWLFDLLGLLPDSVQRRSRLVAAARRLVGFDAEA